MKTKRNRMRYFGHTLPCVSVQTLGFINFLFLKGIKQIGCGCAIIFLVILCAENLIAQSGSLRIGIQSPNAASLGKYGEVPVSLYTGVPNITIPLYKVRTGDLTLPIALRYHAGGIKVQQKASWVGLGWSLHTGGLITRTTIGVPDDKVNGYYNTGEVLYSGDTWKNPEYSFLLSVKHQTIDTEPDKFFLNLNGFSGQMVLGPKDLSNYEPRTIPYKKIKISPTFNAGDSYWNIITENGTKYIFGNKGGAGAIEKVTDFNVIEPGGNYASNYGESYISAWYPLEISSISGNRRINFSYDRYTTIHKTNRLYEEKFHNVVSSWEEPCVGSSFLIRGKNQISIPKLTRISWDGGRIEFIANTLREDYLSPLGNKQAYQLDEVHIYSNNELIKKYLFVYSYFSGSKRLRLDKIREIAADGTEKPSYKFVYNSASLPSTNSNSIDHWGYYNGKSNSTQIPEYTYSSGETLRGADRTPNPSTVGIGILQKIIYPTGGWTEFEFEPNDYGSISGDPIKDKVLSDPQTASVTSRAEHWKRESFTIGGMDEVEATIDVRLDPYDCGRYFGCPAARIYNSSGTIIREYLSDGSGPLITDQITLAPGDYTLEAYTDSASGYTEDQAYIMVEWQEETTVTVDKKIAGGLRIKEIRSYSGVDDSDPQIYSYRYKDSSGKSSGVILREPKYHYWYSTNTCSYLSRSSNSKIPLGMTQGGSVGYKKVTVLHGENSEYGKGVHFFRTAEDAPDIDYSPWWPFARYTSQDWKRGQKVKSEIFDEALFLKKRKLYTHAFNRAPSTLKRYRGLSVNFLNYEYTVFNSYEVISGWPYMIGISTQTFKPNSPNPVTKSIKYNYNNLVNLQPTKVIKTNSNGQQHITEYTYAYEVGDEIQIGNLDYTAMQDLNMLTQPFSVTVKNGTGTVLSKHWILWDNTQGWWAPESKWIWKGGNPNQPIFIED